jgi:aminoglycoside phosphotransferase (APT) family kinase protein
MNGNETMRRESRMLEALAKTDVPHPHLIAKCDDESVLGSYFYLMEPVNGFNATEGLPRLHSCDSEIRWEMGIAIVDGIASLGKVDYKAVGLEGFGRPEAYLERQVRRWQYQLESYAEYRGWSGPSKIPGVDHVGRWLDDNCPPSSGTGIIHGDYHFGNVLYRYDGPELAAIVDWELTTIGDPLVDLGGLLSTWGNGVLAGIAKSVEPTDGFPTALDLIARYGELSSRNLSAIKWYIVLSCYKIGIILEGSNARAAAGRAPRDIGDRLHAGAVSLFKHALSTIDTL